VYDTKETIYGNQRPNDVRYAGFWVRAIASLLDGLILGIPILMVLTLIFGDNWLHQEFSSMDVLYQVVLTAVTVILWVNWEGRTPGKKLLGIKVVQGNNYEPVSYSKAILRYLGYFVSFLALGIGFLMVAFRADKRGLHDLIAGTYVIYEKTHVTAQESGVRSQ